MHGVGRRGWGAPDGQCEMRAGACAFHDVVPWSGVQPAPRRVRAPVVLTDFSCRHHSMEKMPRRRPAVLASSCDAVLVGEHQNKPDFPPTLMGRLLLDAGVTPWITLSCRDRNRVVLEQELRGLRSIGVETVMCVTGDGRGYDVRADVTQTFDLDGPRLVSLAASVGIVAAVPETPTAPPVAARPARLVEKERAGASLAVLNHVPFPDMIAHFMKSARLAGLSLPVIAAVAVFTDSASAAVLQGLPGLELDEAATEQILGAADPVDAGIEAAVAEHGRRRRSKESRAYISGPPSRPWRPLLRRRDQGRGRPPRPGGRVVSEAMDAEFDTVAEWTAQVAVKLGPDFYVPAACRGSGSPAALDWLIDHMRLVPGDRLLDCGAGTGGPAAYARAIPLSAPSARRTGSGRMPCGENPFRSPGDTRPGFGAADCRLEIRRRLVTGCLVYDDKSTCVTAGTAPHGAVRGRIGLLAFVAHRAIPSNQLEDNYFPTTDGLVELVDEASLGVEQWLSTADLPAIPEVWSERVEMVDDALADRYGHTRAWRLAERQSGKIGQLLEEGTLTGELLVLRHA